MEGPQMPKRIPARLYMIMAIISFVIAAIPAFGLVMRADPVGRVIFAVVWIVIGVAWLGQAFHAKQSGER
jgi:hypothetical protein